MSFRSVGSVLDTLQQRRANNTRTPAAARPNIHKGERCRLLRAVRGSIRWYSLPHILNLECQWRSGRRGLVANRTSLDRMAVRPPAPAGHALPSSRPHRSRWLRGVLVPIPVNQLAAEVGRVSCAAQTGRPAIFWRPAFIRPFIEFHCRSPLTVNAKWCARCARRRMNCRCPSRPDSPDQARIAVHVHGRTIRLSALVPRLELLQRCDCGPCAVKRQAAVIDADHRGGLLG